MATLSKEQSVTRAQLVSVFEASCSLEYPDAGQLEFRVGLMHKLGPLFDLKTSEPRLPGPLSKETLRERAYLVRLFKSICRVNNPAKIEVRFQTAVTNKLRAAFSFPGAGPRPPASCPHN